MSTVLVVEDDLAHRQIILKILKKIGVKVIVARDGVEAIEMAQSKNPQLIILDVIIPRMNGYEVCRRLKADERTKGLAVIMYSNKDEEWDFYWGCKQGADAYVSKLCQPQELIDTIKTLLQQ
jgi:twitching motility two-component system response regulator PilH